MNVETVFIAEDGRPVQRGVPMAPGRDAERLAGLRSLLQRDSAMRIEARSPLMLSLMSRAYQDVPADQLLKEGGASAAARRKQLMEAYVARMFRRAAQGRGG